MIDIINIEYNTVNGGVQSILCSDDKSKMNWIEGVCTFGTVKNAEVVSVKKTDTGITSVYITPHLTITVTRTSDNYTLNEKYVITNRLASDVFIGRGMLGIYATFNDSYENAKICMNSRCHTHIWCGDGSSYVKAVKMGNFDQVLGLILKQGNLDTYSIERDLSKISNDRGDFILHPSPFHLKPDESTVIEWELFFTNESDFKNQLDKRGAILVDAENFTVFSDEIISFSVNKPFAKVELKGKTINTFTKGNKTYVNYTPQILGEHSFKITANGKITHADFFVQLPFTELIHKRAEFIVKNQQFHCDGSPLDGAYLIYDNKDKQMYFDELDTDRNASRERLMIGLFLAKYLQYYPNNVIYESLIKYYRFVAREFYNEETGEVYNAIRRNPEFKRLYNAPWMSVFVMEMYKLTKDKSYLEKMFKLLTVYYSIGGDSFYPNGLSIFESVEALNEAGMYDKAKELKIMYQKHIQNIVKTGVYYPEHEVKYEQTIVTPAVNLIAQMYMLTKDDSLIEPCYQQLKILEKFNGDQPSHHLHEMSIRHWDGYWFGKRRNYGDTFPHPASVHTANAFLHYAQITSAPEYRERAYRSARNLLSLFNPDGSASNCYVYPFSVNGIGCEYYDEFANDQDGALYYLIKFFKLHKEI